MNVKHKPLNKTHKANFSTIVIENEKVDIEDIITRTNIIVNRAYSLIRLYLIQLFSKDEDLPKLTSDFIYNSMIAITRQSVGPKSTNSLLDKLKEFYRKEYHPLIFPKKKFKCVENNKLDKTNLSYILRVEADKMNISYVNNIQLNYMKYIRQFVNQSFKKKNDEALLKAKLSEKTKKEIASELNKVKNDILNVKIKDGKFKTDYTSNVKYHKWLTKMIPLIVPKFKSSLDTFLKTNPFMFLKHMMYMNTYLESKGLKLFQPISLRTDIKNKYITINTSALIDILPLKNKNEYFKDVRKVESEIWAKFVDVSKFKFKGYVFNHLIETDGYSVSINFINKNELDEKTQKLDNFRKGRDRAKKLYKDKSREEIDKIKKKNEEDKKEQKRKDLEKSKVHKKKMSTEFNKLSKEEKDKIRLKMRLSHNEFNHIGDLIGVDEHNSKLIEYYMDNKIAYIDPGKRSPLYLMNNKGEYMEYRTRNRLKETKRLKYNTLIDNKKKKIEIKIEKENMTIKKLEAKLSELGKKTMNIEQFKKYLCLKEKLRDAIMKHQKTYNKYLQKLKWHAYINKRRHEDNLLNRIEKFLGAKDSLLVIGDWSGNGEIKYISTPGIGLRRKLQERSKDVVLLDEYKTSKIDYRTQKECDNYYVRKPYLIIKENKATQETIVIPKNSKKIHSILTSKMSNGRMRCINRDPGNAVNNFKIIVESLLFHKIRPEIYSRNKKSS